MQTIIADVNADEHEDLAREYDVSGFPTFIHFPAFNTSQRPMVYTAEQDVRGAPTTPVASAAELYGHRRR